MLDGHVTFALAEAELSKPTCWSMTFNFSTMSKPNMEIE